MTVFALSMRKAASILLSLGNMCGPTAEKAALSGQKLKRLKF